VREEWESKVRAVESDLGATAAKFDRLASLAVLQQGRQVFGFVIVGGSAGTGASGSGETVKGGFHHHCTSISGRGALSSLLVHGV
jgi:hypothetical protein